MSSFDWASYIACAELLATSGATEASKRSAISRAYYAAYNVVRIFMNLTIPKDSDSHKFVWDAAKNDRRAEMQLIGKKEERLKGRRKAADYETRFDDVDYWMKESIENAKKIVDGIQALRNPPPPPPPPSTGSAA